MTTSSPPRARGSPWSAPRPPDPGSARWGHPAGRPSARSSRADRGTADGRAAAPVRISAGTGTRRAAPARICGSCQAGKWPPRSASWKWTRWGNARRAHVSGGSEEVVVRAHRDGHGHPDRVGPLTGRADQALFAVLPVQPRAGGHGVGQPVQREVVQHLVHGRGLLGVPAVRPPPEPAVHEHPPRAARRSVAPVGAPLVLCLAPGGSPGPGKVAGRRRGRRRRTATAAGGAAGPGPPGSPGRPAGRRRSRRRPRR